ncbi:MAG: glutamine synthetase III [Saprospiraceae bacterium]|nr:glutamine synthetase III [Saprospiraceae bacterium]
MNNTAYQDSKFLDPLDKLSLLSAPVSEYFGSNTFNRAAMEKYLPEDVLHLFDNALRTSQSIDRNLADAFAEGLKNWAIDNGAKHYTHWIQPINNNTAEKHDAFFKPALDRHNPSLESFSGSDLMQKEPDASSFPSGGLRNTAQARGYSVWDPTATIFILETELSKTLYIPSIYIAWTGEALDYKTPLLRSLRQLDRAATEVARLFNPDVKGVKATLGWEQEYFVVEEDIYHQRPDLKMAGRTLFGNKPARNQQLEDHYFGAIPERVQNFIADFETEAHRLGIPVVTRHNEVAPSQYECAPMFEDVNNAVDHNLLLMNLMRRVASRHGLRVLLHEKPFAGINGNGKHNNWSLSTYEGHNLLSPGKDPGHNLSFLTFFVNIVAAVNRFESLIRASIATPGNDHRLGANEAPPAIISVYTGEFIEKVLERFKTEGLHEAVNAKSVLQLDLYSVPTVELDSTDRNRTSPFPFTGNKFEYRAVGASANCAQALTVLQAAVADQLAQFKQAVDEKTQRGQSVEESVVEVLQQTLRENERIIFNGNGYSAEWEAEAARRGLSNNKTAPDALGAYLESGARELFERTNVLNERELEARYEIFAEEYIKVMELEARMMLDICNTNIIPGANAYLGQLAATNNQLAQMSQANGSHALLTTQHNLNKLLEAVNCVLANTFTLEEKLTQLHHQGDVSHILQYAGKDIKPTLESTRRCVDALELLVDDERWPFPKYQDMLFNF